MNHLKSFNESIGIPRRVRGPKPQKPIGVPRKITRKENNKFIINFFEGVSEFTKEDISNVINMLGIVILDKYSTKSKYIWLVECDESQISKLEDRCGDCIVVDVNNSYTVNETLSKSDSDLTYDRSQIIEELIKSTDIEESIFKNEIISDLRNLYSKLDDEYLKTAHYINQLSEEELDEVFDDIDMESYLSKSNDLSYEMEKIDNKYLSRIKK